MKHFFWVFLLFLSFTVSAQSNFKNTQLEAGKIAFQIPELWEVSQHQVDQNSYTIYNSPANDAFFCITVFENQENALKVIQEFLKSSQSQSKKCSFSKIREEKKPGLSSYRVDGQAEGMKIQVITLKSQNKVTLAYTLSTSPKNENLTLKEILNTFKAL